MYCPFVSVIVPVFNDAGRLRLCLAALDEQSYPPGLYEVILVDNGSDEDLAPIVREARQARLVREARPGSYAARNRGIEAARGAVLAFTDADCIPAADWIERGAARLVGTPGCGAVGGRVELLPAREAAPTAAELYDQLTHFRRPAHIRGPYFGATANLFTFKDVVQRVGRFEEGMKSTADFDWGGRVAAAGYEQLYADEVIVRHPARASVGALCRKQARITGGLHDGQQLGVYPTQGLHQRIAYDFGVAVIRTGLLWRDRALPGRWTKIKVLLVMYAVTLAGICEQIRLRLGGTSRR